MKSFARRPVSNAPFSILAFAFFSFVVFSSSALLIGVFQNKALLFLIPFIATAAILGYKRPDLAPLLFLAAVPFSGFLSAALKIKSIPALAVLLAAGSLGRLIPLFFQKKRPTLDLPIPFWVIFSSLIFSMILALASFRSYYPDPNAIVTQAPWGSIYLKNAIGWVLLTFTLNASGLLLFEWIYSLKRQNLFQVEKCLNLIFLSFSIPFAVGLAQFMQWTSWRTSPAFMEAGLHQYSATFSDPNGLGLYTALLFPLWLASIFQRPRFTGVWVAGIFLLFLMLLSGSRSAVLVLLIGVVLFFLITGFRFKRSFALMPILMLILILGLSFGIFSQTHSAKLRSFSFFKDIRSTGFDRPYIEVLLGQRRDLWKAGWTTFKHNPVFGVGLGTYLIKVPRYKDEIKSLINDNSCNMYLHVAAEQGVMGFLLFFGGIGWLLLIFLKQGLGKLNFHQIGAFSSIASLSIAFLFGAHLLNFEAQILFWFLLALLASRTDVS